MSKSTALTQRLKAPQHKYGSHWWHPSLPPCFLVCVVISLLCFVLFACLSFILPFLYLMCYWNVQNKSWNMKKKACKSLMLLWELAALVGCLSVELHNVALKYNICSTHVYVSMGDMYFNKCLMPPCSHTVNSSSICDKSTNGQKDPFQLRKNFTMSFESHILLTLEPAVFFWSTRRSTRHSLGGDSMQPRENQQRILCVKIWRRRSWWHGGETRPGPWARPWGSHLGRNAEPLREHGRRPTWSTPPCRCRGIWFFYTTSIRVKVRLCTHEAMADLNTATTEPCFHLRSCSIFRLKK